MKAAHTWQSSDGQTGAHLVHELISILQRLLQGGRDYGVGGCSRGKIELALVSSSSLRSTLITWLHVILSRPVRSLQRWLTVARPAPCRVSLIELSLLHRLLRILVNALLVRALGWAILHKLAALQLEPGDHK